MPPPRGTRSEFNPGPLSERDRGGQRGWGQEARWRGALRTGWSYACARHRAQLDGDAPRQRIPVKIPVPPARGARRELNPGSLCERDRGGQRGWGDDDDEFAGGRHDSSADPTKPAERTHPERAARHRARQGGWRELAPVSRRRCATTTHRRATLSSRRRGGWVGGGVKMHS